MNLPRDLMDLYQPSSIRRTRRTPSDFGADQFCTFQDNHLEVWNDPWSKFRAVDKLVTLPHPHALDVPNGTQCIHRIVVV